MSKEISLFNGYSQKENRATNYCLLMLKLLYKEKPSLLGEFISSFEDINGNIIEDLSTEVNFLQQYKTSSSVPDGCITQNSFEIIIEAKTTDWFTKDQLQRHIDTESFKDKKHLFLIALANFETKNFDFKTIELPKDQSVRILKVDYTEFLEHLKKISKDKTSISFKEYIDDFESYLDEENLLSSWSTRLDVVNCAQWPHVDYYSCPATGGSYKHKKSKYLGFYKNKKLTQFGEIKAVVNIYTDGTKDVEYKNQSSLSDSALIEEAVDFILNKNGLPQPDGHRVFILDKDNVIKDFNGFGKDSPGGMLGSKMYFDLNLYIEGIQKMKFQDIANALKEKKWSER